MLLKRHQAAWIGEALKAEAWRFRHRIRVDPLAEERLRVLEGAAHVLAEGEALVPLQVVPEDEEKDAPRGQ